MRAQKAYETALSAAAAEKNAEIASVRRSADELLGAELKAARIAAEQEQLAALAAARATFEESKRTEMEAMKCAMPICQRLSPALSLTSHTVPRFAHPTSRCAAVPSRMLRCTCGCARLSRWLAGDRRMQCARAASQRRRARP